MPNWQLETLSYQPDSAGLVDLFIDMPWCVFLDSCQPLSVQGRYDIITAAPYRRFITEGEHTRVEAEGESYVSERSPFELIDKYLPRNQELPIDLPFQGGALGYFAYDLARRVERIPTLLPRVIDLPDMAIGLYDWAIIIDHQLKKTTLFAAHRHPSTVKVLNEVRERLALKSAQFDSFHLDREFQSNTPATLYSDNFHTIQAHIRRGDCYQVNYSQSFSAPYQGDPWLAYKQLRRSGPVPYAAFMRIEQGDILSLSPERFLLLDDGMVETKPIKGTVPRGGSAQEDQRLAETLLASEKDRAENTMIVDLLRNDLGRVCRPGSIEVPSLCALESFPAVHHLVSTIRGQLACEHSALSLLEACFPGGSVVGAPKCRVMEIIEQLECQRRAVYCGSLAYISAHGRMDSNIAIRSLMAVDNTLYCAGGGGIVYDSDCDREYQESLDKIAMIARCLERSIRTENIAC